MIEALVTRGGPSQLHERRAAVLSTMASLTGHTESLPTLLDASRPDVLQLRPVDGSLFIGDAKATETPGNAQTFTRLTRYAEVLAAWVQMGGSGVLALIVDEVAAYGWLNVLRDVGLELDGGKRIAGHVDSVESGTAIVWQSFTTTPVREAVAKTRP